MPPANDRDMTINLIVNAESFRFSIQEELRIDRDDLDNELARQAAHYAWFSVLCERARAERVALEGELEGLEYQIDQEIRAALDAEDGEESEEDRRKRKKPTEAAIKARVRTDPRYHSMLRRLQRIEHDERLLGAIRQALEQRKDMLIALSRSRYHEMSAPSADEVERIKRNLMGRR